MRYSAVFGYAPPDSTSLLSHQGHASAWLLVATDEEHGELGDFLSTCTQVPKSAVPRRFMTPSLIPAERELLRRAFFLAMPSSLHWQACERDVVDPGQAAAKEENLSKLAWALVHSRRESDVLRGVAMLEGEARRHLQLVYTLGVPSC